MDIPLERINVPRPSEEQILDAANPLIELVNRLDSEPVRWTHVDYAGRGLRAHYYDPGVYVTNTVIIDPATGDRGPVTREMMEEVRDDIWNRPLTARNWEHNPYELREMTPITLVDDEITAVAVGNPTFRAEFHDDTERQRTPEELRRFAEFIRHEGNPPAEMPTIQPDLPTQPARTTTIQIQLRINTDINHLTDPVNWVTNNRLLVELFRHPVLDTAQNASIDYGIDRAELQLYVNQEGAEPLVIQSDSVYGRAHRRENGNG